ncbi:MAG: NfeD family protein [Nitrososphaerota archaeon]|nr:NfeD family protein [Nitrososphaerota archaeon]
MGRVGAPAPLIRNAPFEALPASGEVSLFSWDRWGIGSLFMIGTFLGVGLIFFVRWMITRGFFSLSVSLLLFIGAGIFFVVKASESIERAQFGGYDPVGKEGVVTAKTREGKGYSVRVDGLDWSARCKEALAVGDEVLVVSRDGLHLAVEKKPRPGQT